MAGRTEEHEARSDAPRSIEAGAAGLLRSILDAQLETICRFRSDGTILFANQAYARMCGSTAAELEGRNFWEFVTEGDRASVEAALATLTPETPEVSIENRFESVSGT